jgi:hypothetical protein
MTVQKVKDVKKQKVKEGAAGVSLRVAKDLPKQ